MGLIGEAGEIANKANKIIRDDRGKLMDEREEAIFGELGDVCWYVAVYMHYNRIKPADALLTTTLQVMTDYAMCDVVMSHALSLCISASNVVTCSYVPLTDEMHKRILNNLNNIITDIVSIAKLCGYTFEQVLEHNVQKLASRKKRNKISGSGDNR